MNFYVDPAQGHNDFLMSLALLVEAVGQYAPRGAKGSSSDNKAGCKTPLLEGDSASPYQGEGEALPNRNSRRFSYPTRIQ